MREPRNPFQMRASEYIDSQTAFLRLFAPEVLEVVETEGIWNRVQVFRSAPGGGKTTLFRVFTPSALRTLHEGRSSEEYRDLYTKMEELGVVDESGPRLLGVMQSCARTYAGLDDMKIEDHQKNQLFNSLLASRIIASALRNLKDLLYANSQDWLDEVEILSVPGEQQSSELNDSPTIIGKHLYEQALETERSICEFVDSLSPGSLSEVKNLDLQQMFSYMKPERMRFRGEPVAQRIIVMLDDVHRLTTSQRKSLLGTLVDMRYPQGIWIAMRLEALSSKDILSRGSTIGREYQEAIDLEDFWREHPRKFEKMVTDIADRRARSTREIQFDSFGDNIQESLDGMEWHEKFSEIHRILGSRLALAVTSTDNPLEKTEPNRPGSLREQVVDLRGRLILLERKMRKRQAVLEVGIPRQEDDIGQGEASEVRNAAELFVSNEFMIPYYYGMKRLAGLSSSNIEQFLALAGDIFEEIISARVLGKLEAIHAERQMAILKEFSSKRWDEIPRRTPYGAQARSLLSAIGRFSKEETMRPNAPYAPGVTGIGISERDKNRLIELSTDRRNPQYSLLSQVISACISQNLLEPNIMRQGGQYWLVLYLNRWICLYYDLPLNYGGWRAIKIDQLYKWASRDSAPPTRNGVIT